MNFETTIEHKEGEENPMITQAVNFFHLMLDTLANATQLAKDVKGLTEEVAKLRGEVEEVHLRNMELTDKINTVRAERDDFASKYAQASSELAVAQDSAQYHERRANGLDQTLATMREEHQVRLETLIREKDSSIETWRNEHEALRSFHKEVTEQRDALAKELAETKERFQTVESRLREIVGGLSPVATPEPQPQPVEEWRSASGY